jgi:GDP-L-fucose synthase
MVANALKKFLPEATYLTRDVCDLSMQDECDWYFGKKNPKVVIHLAGRVGGIVSNSSRPYDYFYDNVIVNTNVIHNCIEHKVKYLISASSTCSYPSKSDHYPMKEKDIHNGPPEETNLYYAYAKRMMQVHSSAAREQHNLNCCVLYISNLYGPYDNFSVEDSHVIPALIMKFHEVKLNNKSIKLKGTPDGLRQFTYVEDLAAVIKKCVISGVIGDYNFGKPGNISIGELVDTLKKVVGCKNEVIFDQKLRGVYRKDVDSSALIERLGFDNFTELETGLRKTYQWYLENNNVEIV